MSSDHMVIIARNDKTGALELPLEDMTLYGEDGAESVLQLCRLNYTEDWTLTLYGRRGASWSGEKVPSPTRCPACDPRNENEYHGAMHVCDPPDAPAP